MIEKRQVERELTVGVTAMAHRLDGTVLEGVVRDVSDRGIRISGDATGLAVGDLIDIVVVVNSQPVRYACEVRHADGDKRFYGVRFRSGPAPLVPPHKVKHCMRCSRDFPTECNFCSHCGQRLVAMTS